jgi:hypothetical protein
MEILRVAENISPEGVGITIEVPGSHAESEHVLTITDLSDLSISTSTITTAGGDSLILYLNEKYDNSYSVALLLDDIAIFLEEYTLVRPYINPNTLGSTASEIAEYKKWELIARSIIDNYAQGIDFYNRKSAFQTRGSNADYMPIWKNTNAVLKVYENNVLIYNADDFAILITDAVTDLAGTTITTTLPNNYAVGDIVTLAGFTNIAYNTNHRVLEILNETDFRIQLIEEPVLGGQETVKRFWASEFKVTPDKSAIYRTESGEAARLSYSTIKLPASRGDIATGIFNYGTFPERYEYIFILDEGFSKLPTDISYATEMLIDDLKCGRLEYYQRYITSYNTDQFKIQFDKNMLSGTGNIIVDRIVDKYAKPIKKVGVL